MACVTFRRRRQRGTAAESAVWRKGHSHRVWNRSTAQYFPDHWPGGLGKTLPSFVKVSAHEAKIIDGSKGVSRWGMPCVTVLWPWNLDAPAPEGPTSHSCLSDHYMQVLVCQHECVRELATRPGRLSPIENFLPLHYDYLQFAYYRGKAWIVPGDPWGTGVVHHCRHWIFLCISHLTTEAMGVSGLFSSSHITATRAKESR